MGFTQKARCSLKLIAMYNCQEKSINRKPQIETGASEISTIILLREILPEIYSVET